MILHNATIKYKGYDPSTLSKGSHKRICVSCDNCGQVRYVSYQAYRNLCGSCSKSGKNNSQYGKPRSEKVKEKIRKNSNNKGKNNGMYGKRGKDCPNWKGGFNISRPYLLSEIKCIKLNERFINSEFHHLMKGVGVYIPKELHRHIWHSIKNNKNMDKINMLAIDYLVNNL